jgi:hypothetical protein
MHGYGPGRRIPDHRVDDGTVGVADRIFSDEPKWMFTRSPVREYGIKRHADAVKGDGLHGR